MGATVSSFTWFPSVAHAYRDWMNQDIMTIMYVMKHFDMRTDEVADDCRKLQNKLIAYQKELDDNPRMEQRSKLFIERQIREIREELRLKLKTLENATEQDQQILQQLARRTA